MMGISAAQLSSLPLLPCISLLGGMWSPITGGLREPEQHPAAAHQRHQVKRAAISTRSATTHISKSPRASALTAQGAICATILACLVAVWARTMLLVRQCVWRKSPLMCCHQSPRHLWLHPANPVYACAHTPCWLTAVVAAIPLENAGQLALHAGLRIRLAVVCACWYGLKGQCAWLDEVAGHHTAEAATQSLQGHRSMGV